MKSPWNKDRIIAELRRLHRKGTQLSYNHLARRYQALVSAAAYHFGSYRRAVEHAGIDYAEITRRPRWSKPRIIRLIKQAFRDGDDLNWGAVTRRRDELGRAAFASLQPRLFGSWQRALHAAGLDADDVSLYRRWTRESILFELRQRHRDSEPMSSGELQKDDPGLHAAALRQFGTYDTALRAARIDPGSVRLRRRWSRELVIKELRSIARKNPDLPDSLIRRKHAALYGAAVRLFGSLRKARQAV